jgi:hypothetical protein
LTRRQAGRLANPTADTLRIQDQSENRSSHLAIPRPLLSRADQIVE